MSLNSHSPFVNIQQHSRNLSRPPDDDHRMPGPASPLEHHQHTLATGERRIAHIAEDALARANSNASRNTYLHLDPGTVRRDAAALKTAQPQGFLHGVPVSLKDCFDLAGTVTTAGTRFYAEHNVPALEDSAVAQRLRALGCVITGKTHLHPLAYGITGENPDFGDCLQPRDVALLAGGSSSGAAASVQEGSALFAIGTDTGGSIRVPAALCGLAGFRASHNITSRWPTMWRGGLHLAPSFDTLGILTRSAIDLAPIAEALFNIPSVPAPLNPRIGTVPTAFVQHATRDVFASFAAWQDTLSAAGCELTTFNTANWAGALDIFAPIQAHEAAIIHQGHFDEFEPLIAQRLHWGASLTTDELSSHRIHHMAFRLALEKLFTRFDFLILPAAPVHELRAGADHAQARPTILHYTTPFSLGGNPVVSLPGELIDAPRGTGLQIAAAPGRDAELLAFTTALARRQMP